MSLKDNVNSCFNSKIVDKLLAKPRKLMIVCCKNLYHTQKFQKRVNNKSVKPRNFIHSNKIWLKNKYIKTKQNQKMEAKFFKSFRVLCLISKQTYKLEMLKK